MMKQKRTPTVLDRVALHFSTLQTITRVKKSLKTIGYNQLTQLNDVNSTAIRLNVHWSPYQLASAIIRMSSFVKGASCLTQACAAQSLLSQAGYISTMRVGVKSTSDGKFDAHAWVIWQDKILLGGTTSSTAEYKVLKDYLSEPKS